MAKSNHRHKCQETIMHVILEIVKRLPYKLVVQCSVLIKNFRHWTSQPNFLPPHYSAIFHCSSSFDRISRKHVIRRTICQEIRSRRKTKALDANVKIIASCNGLLLLRFDNPDTHYIFNPATSEIATAPGRDLDGFYERVGLAVNWNWNPPIKLVSARSPHSGRIIFTVVVPSPAGSGEFSRSEVVFNCRREIGPRSLKSKPVYAHGSLYWHCVGGGFLVAFEVEKEEARVIHGPPKIDNIWYKILGFADGEIHLVYEMMSGIVIYGHDHRTDGWRVKHRISLSEREFFAKPIFFYGELLVFVEWNGGRVGCYDVKRKVRVNIETNELGFFFKTFFSYRPSFAKVFDTYLDENNTSLWDNESIRNGLIELQKLLEEC